MEPKDLSDRLKRDAAYRACELIEDGMAVGLGTGSTAAWVVRKLGERVRQGLRVTAVATSLETEKLAELNGIALRDVNDVPRLDIAIDGADEVTRKGLELVKGHGGALLREKIVASLTDNFIVVADESKIVGSLGEYMSLPVETVRFGCMRTHDALLALGVEKAEFKRASDQTRYVTDNGNYIFNCTLPKGFDPYVWADRLSGTVGVVEHGLFLGRAKKAFIASESGVTELAKG